MNTPTGGAPRGALGDADGRYAMSPARMHDSRMRIRSPTPVWTWIALALAASCLVGAYGLAY